MKLPLNQKVLNQPCQALVSCSCRGHCQVPTRYRHKGKPQYFRKLHNNEVQPSNHSTCTCLDLTMYFCVLSRHNFPQFTKLSLCGSMSNLCSTFPSHESFPATNRALLEEPKNHSRIKTPEWLEICNFPNWLQAVNLHVNSYQ